MRGRVLRRDAPLWTPVVAPVLWSAHFTVCYIAVAMACGRYGGGQISRNLWFWLLVFTLVSIAGMIAIVVWAVLTLRGRLPTAPHDADTAADRGRFVAFTTLLLAGLSIIATVYATLAFSMVSRC